MKKFVLNPLLGLVLGMSALAYGVATPWQSNKHGQVRLISEWDVAPSTGTLWLGLQFKTAPGWHVYWKNPGDAGYAPRLDWQGSRGIATPTLLWPAPTKFLLPGDLVAFGYEGDIVYPIQATLIPGADPVHLVLDLDYLTCSEPCVPYRYSLTLELPRSGEPRTDVASSGWIQRFRAQIPEASRTDEQIMAAAPVERVGEPVQSSAAGVSTLWGMLVLAFFGGLILNVMPCVLPVISIKLLGLMHYGGQSRAQIVRAGLASIAGIEASFLTLGALAVAVRAAGHSVGWGTQFQNPIFVGLLMIVVFLFALNLWGLFEIPLPRFLGHFAATYGRHETLAAHFMSGLFATLLATPCSAPFLGTAMGFALAQAPNVILASFAAAGLGMSLPYWGLILFPSSLQWLPKPGVWMVRLKAVFGVFLMATALWLGWVLVQQLGSGGSGGRRAGANIAAENTSPPDHSITGSPVWLPFDEAAIPKYLAEGKMVFVDITAAWCFTCKYNEKVVLGSKAVRQAFKNGQVVLMQADWTERDAQIAAFLKKHGRAGIPFAALYRPGQEPKVLPEFLTEKTVLQALNR